MLTNCVLSMLLVVLADLSNVFFYVFSGGKVYVRKS